MYKEQKNKDNLEHSYKVYSYKKKRVSESFRGSKGMFLTFKFL